MDEKSMDVNQMIPQIMDALRNLGVTERGIWRNHHDLYLSIGKFYRIVRRHIVAITNVKLSLTTQLNLLQINS